MILGRPTNLWLGLSTSIVSGLAFVLLTAGVDPTTVAAGTASLTGILGAAILLIANGTPVVNPGSAVQVQTPPAQGPNPTFTAPTLAALNDPTVTPTFEPTGD